MDSPNKLKPMPNSEPKNQLKIENKNKIIK